MSQRADELCHVAQVVAQSIRGADDRVLDHLQSDASDATASFGRPAILSCRRDSAV